MTYSTEKWLGAAYKAKMETLISLIVILAVLGLGVVSLVLCIYYLGKIAVLCFTYYRLGPEKYRQTMSAKNASRNVKATGNKKPRLSITDFLNLFNWF